MTGGIVIGGRVPFSDHTVTDQMPIAPISHLVGVIFGIWLIFLLWVSPILHTDLIKSVCFILNDRTVFANVLY